MTEVKCECCGSTEQPLALGACVECQVSDERVLAEAIIDNGANTGKVALELLSMEIMTSLTNMTDGRDLDRVKLALARAFGVATGFCVGVEHTRG